MPGEKKQERKAEVRDWVAFSYSPNQLEIGRQQISEKRARVSVTVAFYVAYHSKQALDLMANGFNEALYKRSKTPSVLNLEIFPGFVAIPNRPRDL